MPEKVLGILETINAVIKDSHVIYPNGEHGRVYIDEDATYPHVTEISHLCRKIAEQFADDNIEAVIAPAIGGVILSQWVAHHLAKLNNRKVLSVYAEETEKSTSPLWHICFGLRLWWKKFPQLGKAPEKFFAIKQDYEKLIIGKNILVVGNVLATGGSTKKVIKATQLAGGNIVGLGVFCNLSGITSQDMANVKLVALLEKRLSTWSKENCPRCNRGIPVAIDSNIANRV